MEAQKTLCLQSHIKNLIKQNGPLNFKEYMQLCLLHPKLGYYTNVEHIFGKQGDYITAPEMTPIFGQCLANQCIEIINQIQDSCIIELGAGTGKLASDILLHCNNKGTLPQKYYILEVSKKLQIKQCEYLKEKLPKKLFDLIDWLDSPPRNKFNGVLIANEVIDAQSVHRFNISENLLKEYYVTLKNNNLSFELFTPSEQLIVYQDYLLNKISGNYTSEINVDMPIWFRELTKNFQDAILIFIDYGYEEDLYYHPERKNGTLSCFYKHTTNNNPLDNPGNQDITAHVNFTQLADIAAQYGFNTIGFSNQAKFLINCGIQNISIDEKYILQTSQHIKKLILPYEMGETIKVIGLSKSKMKNLMGFKHI